VSQAEVTCFYNFIS